MARAAQGEVERWFARRGLGVLLDDTHLGSHASVRMVPWLLGCFLVVMFALVPGSTSNMLVTVVISLVTALATWVGGNFARGDRVFARLHRVGFIEMAAFVVVPTVAAAVAPYEDVAVWDERISAGDARLLTTTTIAGLQLLLLVVVVAVVQLRLVSVAALLTRQLFTSLSGTATVMARTLPLLLGVVTFFFFTGELWQSVGRLTAGAYLGVVALFVASSTAFLARREHLDVEALGHFSTDDELTDALRTTPLARGAGLYPADDGVAHVSVAIPAQCTLSRGQQRTVLLVATLSRLVVATVVAGAVLAFFLVLGVLCVDASVVATWSGHEPSVLAGWSSSVHDYVVTWQHIRVAGFLAVFAGFYYSVVSATDPTLRQGLVDNTADTVRAACAARLVVLSQAQLRR